MMTVIEAQNVNKSYGKVKALDDFSLKVPQGSLFALLGPNGAGKTTFIRCMLGLTTADQGSITIDGTNSYFESSREKLSYLPEKFNFYPYYTVESTLAFFGRLQGLTSQEIKTKIDHSISLLSLEKLRKRKLKNLSKGQLQRVGLAQLFTSKSNLFILDEPFSGLDPIGIKDLKDLLKKLKSEGKTIFLNTHILSEVEQICDQVAILNKGKIIASGSTEEVRKVSGNLEQTFYDLISKEMDL